IRRKLMQTLILLLGRPILDGDILSLNPAKLAQFLSKRLQGGRHTGSSAIMQEPYAGDFPCRLRADGRPKRQEHGAKRKGGQFSHHIFSLEPLVTRHLTLALLT